MSALLARHVRILLEIEVSVAPEPLGSSGDALAEAQLRLLDRVLSDEELTDFFCRHAAAIPLTDWLRGEPVTGLEWLCEEPQRMRAAILRLTPADQALFGPVLDRRLNGELDRFYAYFRPLYRRIRIV